MPIVHDGAGAHSDHSLPQGGDLALLIFDCDGVLFDSHAANVAFYDAVLASLGLPPLDQEGRLLCHRLSGTQLWDHLFGNDSTVRRELGAATRKVDYAPFYGLMQPVPLLGETLRTLGTWCTLAMATNRGVTLAGVVERFGLGAYFDFCLGVLDVARPKPAPDLLLACLERAEVAAPHALYVGDTELDRQAADAAGIPYVGIGPESRGRWTIGELRELPAFLAGR